MSFKIEFNKRINSWVTWGRFENSVDGFIIEHPDRDEVIKRTLDKIETFKKKDLKRVS